MRSKQKRHWGVRVFLLAALVLCCVAVASAGTVVTTNVRLNTGRLMYDRQTQESYFTASLTNTSSTVLMAPIKVMIGSISNGTVKVSNADEITPDGRPVFEYTTATGQLLPGQTSPEKTFKFLNPQALRFTYTKSVEAFVPETVQLVGINGGTVATPGGVTLTVPPGSMAAPSTITVNAVPPEILATQPAVDNSKIGNAVDFGPSGQTFTSPVSITIPLSSPETPGTTMPLYLYDETIKMYKDSGFTCTVNADGKSCTGQVTHFIPYGTAKLSVARNYWQFGTHHSFDTSGKYIGEYAYFVPGVSKASGAGPRMPNSKRTGPVGGLSRWGEQLFNTPYSQSLPTWSSKPYLASRLFGSISEEIYPLMTAKEPVLFIHGYQPLNAFGGGEDYWGDFLRLVNDLNINGRQFMVFDFQWATNARFQDVAEDLYDAVSAIQVKTGKRVHIVAHSFGGVVARAMLQRYLPAGVDLCAAPMVASLTTIGTPHSGIADGQQSMHGITFPKGQDSLMFEGAGQISVYQMGEDISTYLDDKMRQALEISNAPGEAAAWIAGIYSHPLPDFFPMQVAIGLTGDAEASDSFKLRTGDELISYEGQRFLPSLTVNGFNALLAGSTDYRAQVKETLLGLKGEDRRPGDELYITNYPNFGTAGTVGWFGLEGYGYSHSEGTDDDYSFMENVVNYADGATHASFLAVKEWLTRYSSASAPGSASCGGAASSTLPDTGQTKCYNNTSEIIPCPSPGQPFYGQDANYYTINQPAYTPHGDTVTDNVTGLMWQREDDNIYRTWDAAMSYCQDSGLGGYNDWRLPSKKELMGLVNYNIPYPGPTIDTNAFPVTNSWYWSSTTYAVNPGSAWVVYFYGGSVGFDGKGYNGYVRCVRGGQ